MLCGMGRTIPKRVLAHSLIHTHQHKHTYKQVPRLRMKSEEVQKCEVWTQATQLHK